MNIKMRSIWKKKQSHRVWHSLLYNSEAVRLEGQIVKVEDEKDSTDLPA
jgi:hypothetical protein